MRRRSRRPGEYRHGGPLRVALAVPLLAVAVLGFVQLVGSSDNHSGRLARSVPAELIGYGTSGPIITGPPGPLDPGGPGDPATEPKSFSIAGNVGGLFPGTTMPLVLTVTNLLKVAISVTSISTAVSTGSSKCAAANVKVATFSGHLAVRAGAKAHATVKVTMAHTAPNGCQGAVFPFVYTGVAVASEP